MKEKDNLFKRYGSAPVGKMIFCEEEKRKEWEQMDPSIKKSVISMLHETTKRLTNEMSIELLANMIIDMQDRIEILENRLNENL